MSDQFPPKFEIKIGDKLYAIEFDHDARDVVCEYEVTKLTPLSFDAARLKLGDVVCKRRLTTRHSKEMIGRKYHANTRACLDAYIESQLREQGAREYEAARAALRVEWARAQLAGTMQASLDERRSRIDAAIEQLRATRDRDRPGRWKYFADETSSHWSVTEDALAQLGEALLRGDDRDAAYNTWAQEDTTSHEIADRSRNDYR